MLAVHDLDEILERFFSYLSTGDIDDALQGEGIFRIIDDTDIGKDILDLFPLIELHTSVYSIWYIFADERLFEKSRLSVSPIEYCKRGIIDMRRCRLCRCEDSSCFCG